MKALMLVRNLVLSTIGWGAIFLLVSFVVSLAAQPDAARIIHVTMFIVGCLYGAVVAFFAAKNVI